MKESIGYTVTLNIVITFIIIVFAFLSAALIYFKSNKVSNIITETIEKYEGYNGYAINEIASKLTSLGYNKKSVNCVNYYNKIGDNEKKNCSTSLTDGSEGYCVFVCREKYNEECYYYYKISTNMMINIPIINNMLDIPIFSNTNRLYDFEDQTCE
ncbi:MAG: hypothetical protein E7174_01415 [Firmicutes bacterium]|nr:hypothetical protein [Bacillota bacterium]